MMRKYVFLLVITVLSLVLGSCAVSPQTVNAKLGEEFSLQIGQMATLTSENLSITFKEVVSDSRCPIGVTCVWAGQVSCLTEIMMDSTMDKLVLTLEGSGSANQSFKGYKVAFNVTPYPEAGKQIAQGDYRLVMTISKSLEARLGEQFSLKIGQTATILNENMAITFKEVLTDSRCPTGVTCVWAGEVSCLTEIVKGGAINNVVLTQPGASDPATENYDGYNIAFNVTPYPEAGKQIAPGDYRMILTIGK